MSGIFAFGLPSLAKTEPEPEPDYDRIGRSNAEMERVYRKFMTLWMKPEVSPLNGNTYQQLKTGWYSSKEYEDYGRCCDNHKLVLQEEFDTCANLFHFY